MQQRADAGNAEAQFHMYVHYMHASDTAVQDTALGLTYLQLAAAQGHIYSMHNLAVHRLQLHTPQGDQEAVAILEKAAARGSDVSAAELGNLYLPKSQGLGRSRPCFCVWTHCCSYSYFLFFFKKIQMRMGSLSSRIWPRPYAI